MALQQLKDRRLLVISTVLFIGIVMGVAVASVTISNVSPNPLEAVEGTMNDSGDFTVKNINVTYEGLDATKTLVDINNTAGSSQTANVFVVIRKDDGTTVETQVNRSVSFTANERKNVTVMFASDHKVDTFDVVEVTVEDLT
ncbi:MAG: hypothetical protein SXQ77_03955 [Halobacteria archaeon]|nr:hypothetical protein [Halobacteria archaeon]